MDPSVIKVVCRAAAGGCELNLIDAVPLQVLIKRGDGQEVVGANYNPGAGSQASLTGIGDGAEKSVHIGAFAKLVICRLVFRGVDPELQLRDHAWKSCEFTCLGAGEKTLCAEDRGKKVAIMHQLQHLGEVRVIEYIASAQADRKCADFRSFIDEFKNPFAGQ